MSDDSLDQADIVAMCPILLLTEFDPEGVKPPQITVSSCRVLVLSQACDLANRKASQVTVAVVHNARSLVEQDLLPAHAHASREHATRPPRAPSTC